MTGISPQNALPEDIIAIFSRTIPTGIQHGTVTVIIDDEAFEVTTYRLDGDYLDMRRPRTVSYSQKLEDDLSRRDFTINAMVAPSISRIVLLKT